MGNETGTSRRHFSASTVKNFMSGVSSDHVTLSHGIISGDRTLEQWLWLSRVEIPAAWITQHPTKAAAKIDRQLIIGRTSMQVH